MRLLVVEDHPSLGSDLKKGLEHDHYAVDLVASGEDAEVVINGNTITLSDGTGNLSGYETPGNEQRVEHMDVNNGVLVRLLDAHGKVVQQTRAFRALHPPQTSVTQPLQGTPWQGTVTAPQNQEVRVYSQALTEGGQIVAVIQVGQSLVAANAEQLAAERNILLSVQTSESVYTLGDEARLIQVVMNLLDNAIFYTNAGGRVHVTAQATPTEARLVISDTGIGIAPQHLPHLFERFYRADPARQRTRSSSTGLGLAIVDWVVRAHGGTVSVESQVGRGSTFTVTLPLAPKCA